MSWDAHILARRKCPTCQKMFYCYPSEHAYKFKHNGKTKLYCKWTCLLEGKRKAKERGQKKVKNLS